MKAGRKRLEREYFERLYEKDPDPWGFETSEYERRKYRATLDALGERRFDSGLEVGCSIGVFTGLLADRCGSLLAVDASERAVAAARTRLSGRGGVRVERRTIPEETPSGLFDLVVASEVLYYLPEAVMLDALRRLEAVLLPGGIFVAVHWRRETRTYPLGGDDVHRLIREREGPLSPVLSKEEPDYLLDVYRKDGG
ncbi:class I SAM-dependent DNA methyltransferase [Rubrobacter indicoceani]|uniref:class I SAM-dependent DNA methyltransferase n=1 Tax=Rubrobacter indicoceani TaxID=2051957 RepID=UPI0013C48B70|nr:SAM-dependent methyltransferase [Rubrobacter indicoceani]